MGGGARRRVATGLLAAAVLLATVVLTSAGAAGAAVGSVASAQPAPGPGPIQGPVPRPVPSAGYSWPLSPAPAVLRPFQPPMHPYGPGHRGVDLAGSAGQQVLAAADGVVVFAAPLAGRGVVSVQHADGLRSTYEPVTAVVTAGAAVRRGQLLGHLEPGHASCAPAVCLHWGVRRDEEYLDPLRLMAGGRVRLLPWDGGER